MDFSGLGSASSPEMVEKWKKGKQFKSVGEMLIEEARAFFVGKTDNLGNVLVEGLIGDKDFLAIDDLEITKIVQHRFNIDRGKVLKEFGPEGLMKVGEEKDVVQYRIREVS